MAAVQPTPWVQTFTGRRVDLLDLRPEDVSVFDVAHALARQSRFLGHLDCSYSVAQHSVHVSRVCDPADALVGLLHDATEAYLGDLPSPIKHGTAMGREFLALEGKVWAVVCLAFGLPFDRADPLRLPASVKRADALLVVAEYRDLMPVHRPDAAIAPAGGLPAWPERVVPWSAEAAEREFLARFRELGGAA